MQTKWVTKLADQFEGEVSEEKAMLDIKRGVRDNLRHESIGLYTTATPKRVAILDPLTGVGVAAIVRIHYVNWKDYKPIAEGKDVIVPHIGNVDTIQIPIDKMWYFSQQLPATDLVRMKNEPYYRARLVELSTSALANTLDSEMFDLLVASAAGQKNATIELKVPKHYNPQKDLDLFLVFADTATGLEKKMTIYNIGTPRKDIMGIVDPYLYTRLIKSLGGFYLAIEKALEFIQNEQIEGSKISGLTLVRHIFMDNVVSKKVSSDFGFYSSHPPPSCGSHFSS